MKGYPYGSQMEKDSKDMVIPVKLFDLGSTITWWLSEYDPESKVALAYVTGFVEDEWGTVSLEELEDLELVEFEDFWKISATPRVEIDNHFKPTKFPELPFNKENSH